MTPKNSLRRFGHESIVFRAQTGEGKGHDKDDTGGIDIA